MNNCFLIKIPLAAKFKSDDEQNEDSEMTIAAPFTLLYDAS